MAIRRQNTRSERMDSLDPYASSTRKKSGLCYAFKEGFCAHGDNCQFRHEEKEKDLDENGDEIIYLESSRLYVNNLAWNVTWQDLKGMFRKVDLKDGRKEYVCVYWIYINIYTIFASAL